MGKVKEAMYGDRINTVGQLRLIMSDLDNNDQLCIEGLDTDLYPMNVDVIEGIKLTDDTIVREVRFCQMPNCEPDTPMEKTLNFIEELREQAQELIDCGNSHEKREGYGMMRVIDAIRPMPNNLYFELVSIGRNEELMREEIQIHCGENGNLFLIKTDEGFIVDVYNQDDNVDTMTIWEDDLTPNSDED